MAAIFLIHHLTLWQRIDVPGTTIHVFYATIAVMDGGKCILQLRGVRPFFSDKFDITKHPKYKYLSDADPKNAFDMEKHIKRRPAIVKPDEVFDYYEIDVQEDAAP